MSNNIDHITFEKSMRFWRAIGMFQALRNLELVDNYPSESIYDYIDEILYKKGEL